MPDDAERLREKLRKLGERREFLDGERDILAAEIRSALERARGVVTMVEAAKLVGLDRTALYRTYIYT